MASSTVINGRMYTPQDDDGNRSIIYLETDIDHVVDTETEKSLRDLLEEQAYTDATDESSGLLSAEDKAVLDSLNQDKLVISENDPNEVCMWYEVLSSEIVSTTDDSSDSGDSDTDTDTGDDTGGTDTEDDSGTTEDDSGDTGTTEDDSETE